MKNMKSLRIALKVLAITAILGLTACDNPFFDWDEPGGGKPGKPPVVNDCNQYGKLVAVTCGPSIYDNLWIQTGENEYLRPCDQSFQTICPLNLHAGDQVKFSYRKINNCTKCKEQITCSAVVPKHTHVIIDCINVIPSSDCQSLIIDQDAKEDNNYIHVISAAIEGRFLKLKIGYSGCSQLPKEAFKLSWNGSFAKSLPPQVWLFPGLTVTPTMCQAYFTTELCYDVSALKVSAAREVQINIGEHSLLF